MALLYRVVAFGRPRGPWRAKEQQAVLDAIQNGLAEYDEWGQLYLEGFAEIQWMREEETRLSA